MENEYKLFVCECIKNRKYLEFDYQDMSNCLIDVSVEDYENFEKGKILLSKENMIRIAKVLCIKKPHKLTINDYIDTSSLSEEEIKDIEKVLLAIEGDDNA